MLASSQNRFCFFFTCFLCLEFSCQQKDTKSAPTATQFVTTAESKSSYTATSLKQTPKTASHSMSADELAKLKSEAECMNAGGYFLKEPSNKSTGTPTFNDAIKARNGVLCYPSVYSLPNEVCTAMGFIREQDSICFNSVEQKNCFKMGKYWTSSGSCISFSEIKSKSMCETTQPTPGFWKGSTCESPPNCYLLKNAKDKIWEMVFLTEKGCHIAENTCQESVGLAITYAMLGRRSADIISILTNFIGPRSGDFVDIMLLGSSGVLSAVKTIVQLYPSDDERVRTMLATSAANSAAGNSSGDGVAGLNAVQAVANSFGISSSVSDSSTSTDIKITENNEIWSAAVVAATEAILKNHSGGTCYKWTPYGPSGNAIPWTELIPVTSPFSKDPSIK